MSMFYPSLDALTGYTTTDDKELKLLVQKSKLDNAVKAKSACAEV